MVRREKVFQRVQARDAINLSDEDLAVLRTLRSALNVDDLRRDLPAGFIAEHAAISALIEASERVIRDLGFGDED